jgi:hypothetical protein
MVEVPTGKASMSWHQYQAALAKNPKCEPPGYIEH